jgi:hypothetical protein
VSPQWRDDALALLSPRGAALRLLPRGLRPVARLSTHLSGGKSGGEPWRAALETLAGALHTLPRRTRCRVIVSSAFTRYALLPFSTTLVDRRSNEALAEHVFRHIHGDQAASWAFRVAPAAAGHRRVACALDSALVEAVRSAAKTCGVSLEAIEPALAAAFNSGRRDLARSCWFAQAEPERIVLGFIHDGEWVHLAAERPSGDPKTALARMIARESLLCAADAASGDLSCWVARFDDGVNARVERFEARASGPAAGHRPAPGPRPDEKKAAA